MTEFEWVAVAVVAVLSAARLTRLATWDKFPPAVWLRDKYADLTDGSGWQLLAFCGYCASFWIFALVVLWADLAGVLDGRTAWGTDGDVARVIWWFANGILGGSYAAAIVMAHDGDEGEDD